MTNLDREICFKLRAARLAAKISQMEIAEEVGCKQSAISMFEQGFPTKLNEEVVIKLAKKFHVELPARKSTEDSIQTSFAPHAFTSAPCPVLIRGFCPNPNCPSNHVFQVDGRTLYLPNREEADPVGGRFCALCGEVLLKKCPNCGAHIHAGAICSHCGEPYLTVAGS